MSFHLLFVKLWFGIFFACPQFHSKFVENITKNNNSPHKTLSKIVLLNIIKLNCTCRINQSPSRWYQKLDKNLHFNFVAPLFMSVFLNIQCNLNVKYLNFWNLYSRNLKGALRKIILIRSDLSHYRGTLNTEFFPIFNIILDSDSLFFTDFVRK